MREHTHAHTRCVRVATNGDGGEVNRGNECAEKSPLDPLRGWRGGSGGGDADAGVCGVVV